jgi:hypothetical protein
LADLGRHLPFSWQGRRHVRNAKHQAVSGVIDTCLVYLGAAMALWTLAAAILGANR